MQASGPDGPETVWLTEVQVLGAEAFEAVSFGSPEAFLAVTIEARGRALDPEQARWRAYRPGRREVPVAEGGSGMVSSLPEGTYDLELVVASPDGEVASEWIDGVEVFGEVVREFSLSEEVATSAEIAAPFRVVASDLGRRASRAWVGIFEPGRRRGAR